MTKENSIKYLQELGKDGVKKVYVSYRESFINFAKKFSSSKEDVLDSYQDAIIILQEKAIRGELNNLKCSLKTYLFSLGKYILYEKNRKKSKTFMIIKEDEDYNYIKTTEVFFNENLNKNQKLLEKAFSSLGKRCKEILTLFYYRGYSIEEIVEALQYENKNVVKSQKSRCIKQIKDKIKTY